ncbi:MAG: translation initiation factor IF-2 [Nanoarchaeota archaeon]
MTIRQPIVAVVGHVDHGKTSLLDNIRGSSVASGEAGGITQKISFTSLPVAQIKNKCPLLEKNKLALKIPGFLLIDTPGHAAFTNLRRRGGALADIAILIIDIINGIQPQTAEAIAILKHNKTPFIIALNKIDAISGWRKQNNALKEDIEAQSELAKTEFDTKLYTLIGALHNHGFEADIFYNVTDFTKKISVIPCSAKTGEGIQELLMLLCGLSQRFFEKQLTLGKEAKGVILEVKKDHAMQHIEAILYDGTLKVGDNIAIATLDKTISAKVKAIHEIQPLSFDFRQVEEAKASTGLRIICSEQEYIQSGMPFQSYSGNIEEIEKEFKKQLAESIKTDKQGVIVKADSLGSIEALLTLLRQENIQVMKASIGSIKKSDISSAAANIEKHPLNAIVLGFNVSIDEEAKTLAKGIKILTNEVVYRLIEDYKKWRTEKEKEIEREKLLSLATLCKLEILQNCIFHNSNPAIFGIRVVAGKLKQNTQLILQSGEEISRVKGLQHEKSNIQEATEGMEIAVSLPGVAFDRQLKNEKYLYSNLGETQFRDFKKNKNLLSSSELAILQEISQIKRKDRVTWGI